MDLEKLARTDKTILITGETGSGKSRLAKRFHFLSGRKTYLHANVCNFSSSLIEAELFGHAKGAFTGAHCSRSGFFESASGGTLFLDEIGELTLEAQSKLLMVLEEGIYHQVGATKELRFQGRLIFATNRNLAQMVEEGRFRADLFQRIRCFEVKLKRMSCEENLQTIIEDAFVRAKLANKKPALLLDRELLDFLMSYHWPGNYRELNNVCEYLSLFGESVAKIENLPGYMREDKRGGSPPKGLYRVDLEAFERDYLKARLEERGYRINKTAREIKISKVTLLSKMKKYGINRDTEKIHLKTVQEALN